MAVLWLCCGLAWFSLVLDPYDVLLGDGIFFLFQILYLAMLLVLLDPVFHLSDLEAEKAIDHASEWFIMHSFSFCSFELPLLCPTRYLGFEEVSPCGQSMHQ